MYPLIVVQVLCKYMSDSQYQPIKGPLTVDTGVPNIVPSKEPMSIKSCRKYILNPQPKTLNAIYTH